MKRAISLVMSIAMLVSAVLCVDLSAFAATSANWGEKLIGTLDDDGTLTISGTGKMYNYIIDTLTPSYSSDRSLIKRVIINSGVTSIGSFAFYGCTNLTSVIIPDSVTSIGKEAFENCTRLTSLTIPDSVTSIGSDAFYDVNNIVYNGPASGSSWGAKAKNGYVDGYLVYNDSKKQYLYGCSAQATNVTIPDSVTKICYRAFGGCTNLTSVAIPNSVISIGNGAFYNCTNLRSVTIPDSVTSIGDSAFYLVKNIVYNGTASGSPWGAKAKNGYVDGYLVYSDSTKQKLLGCFAQAISVKIPNSVTSIDSCAFYGCTNLTSVTIGNSVTSIGYKAFDECTSLTSVTIPNSVTSIGDYAFYCCTSLTSVTIPDSVKKIPKSAFEDCESLTSVTIGNGVTSIGGYAFYWCTSLKSVTIPNSVTNIGNYAFNECTSLTSVTIGNGVENIGKDAFDNCRNLTKVNIMSVEEWCDISFSNGASNPLHHANLYINNELVTELVIPNSVTKIYYAAFYGCKSLTSVTIPNSVTRIGDYAFRQCESLTSVTIPDSVTSIGGSAFSDCSSLTSVTIPNSVRNIDGYAFFGCSSLTSITIPNSVTSIGDSPFSSCKSLINITVDSGNKNYLSENGVLFDKGKTKLIQYPVGNKRVSYDIPNTVTSIGDWIFYNCTSLTSVTIPNSVTSIGRYAFENCTSLTSITIPNSVTSIGYTAFEGCESLADVYYSGTEEEWNSVYIDFCNYNLTNANIHFNSKILYTSYGYMYDDEFNTTKISMPEFGATYSADKSSCIPGIESTVTVRDSKDYCCCNHMISQGVTTVNYAGAKYLLVSAYCGEKEKVNGKEKSIHNSVIYVMREYNNGTRSLVYTVVLDSKSHVGGLAYDGQRVWIANTTSLKAVNMSDIVAKINNGKGYGLIKYASFGKDSNGKNIYTYSLPHKASFLTYFKDMLFVGEYKEIGDALESSPYVYGYSIGQSNGNVKLNLKYKWHIPAMCQGVAFAEHKGSTYGFLSFGYGPVLPSNLRMSMVYFNSNAKSIVELGHINISYPTMLEDLSVDGKYLYSAYESAANCYHKEKKCRGMNTILISDRITASNINSLVALYVAKKNMGSILPFSMSDENQTEPVSVAEYQLGDSITATLYDNGELYINGYGLFYDDITENTLFSDEEFASMVTGLFIDGGITSLPKGVFRNFANLETVQIGLFDNDLTIEPDVFNDCQQLSYLKIGNEYGDAIESVTVASGAFVGCDSLTDFEIRTPNVTIENGAFDDTGAINFISNQPIQGYTEHQHTFEPLMSDDADCCTYYTVMYACDCGYYYYDYDNQTLGNHDFVDGTCSVCGAVDEDTLPVCQHEFTTYNSVGDSTCTEDGTEIAYCDICNEATDVRIEIGSAGHHYTMGEERNITPPTCGDAGKFEYTCDICGEDASGVIEPTGEHNYIETVIPATCTEKGYTTHTCEVCNDEYIDSYVACAGHTPATAISENVINATCTATGSYDEVVYCSVCDEEISRDNIIIPILNHDYVANVIKPTCIKKGYTIYSCECGDSYIDNYVSITGHTYKSYVITPATTSSAGKITTKCTVCGVVKSTQTISRIRSVKLSSSSYTYDGEVKTPSVTIKNVNGKTLVKGTDYTVSYSRGRKYVGKYKVTVRFKGKYSGTKTLYFTIKPMSTIIKSLSACSRGFYVKWYKCTTQTTGYQVQYSTSSKFSSPKTVTISKTGTTSKTVKKLRARKRYYIRVRTYKTVNGTRYYSSWSNAKHITTKR